MCGIAGAFHWEEASIHAVESVVAKMTDAVRHRGPDGVGVVGLSGCQTAAAFGHRRLAIIDLTERGAQPMKSRTAPIWMTFNGEVYNFQPLRRELEQLGHQFESASDSEVVLQAYEAWGPGFLTRLQGMFALAIYDGRCGELLLARDRLGVKPLYYSLAPKSVLFASEVRALLASGQVPRQLDVGAVDWYLRYQTVPTPRTLVRGVSMLPPGHFARVTREGRWSISAYWDLLRNAAPHERPPTAAEVRERVGELLRESVAGHLISDVPVGIFLSGGIDSTALVALAHRLGRVPQTFSVVMPGSSHDEGTYARATAARFACQHTEVVLTERDLRARVPEALDSVDHPTGDGINTFIVSRAVRMAGIRVALSGLGGDEVFGGYPSFGRMRRVRTYGRAWRRSPQVARAAAAATVRLVGGGRVSSEKAAALLEGDGSVEQAFPAMRQVFGRGERRRLLEAPIESGEDEYLRLLTSAVRARPNIDVMTLVSFAEARTYMHDVLLRDSDQMSMAHGLELRVPLLDHPLVEYVMGLPEGLKLPGATPKRLLVEAVGEAMPQDVVRRPKRGFVLPFEKWMRGDLSDLCVHHLGPDGLGRHGLFRQSALDDLWRDFAAGQTRTTWSRPWTLVALDAWLDRNRISV
jgi:asparagine synthase (glutamine-hydrolysing)